MIALEDALHTYEYPGYFKILPAIHNWSKDPGRIQGGKRVPDDFSYTSNNNSEWMTIETLREWIIRNEQSIGKI
jgi:hypothetical protein